MAHTLRTVNLGNTAFAQVTISSYTAGLGGETFTPSELNLAGSIVGCWILNPQDAVSRFSVLPYYAGSGSIMLMAPTTIDTEIGTNANINCSFAAIFQGDGSAPTVPAYVPTTTTINGQPLTGNITISGGGSANTAQAIVDFGNLTPQETTASVTVAATWVTALSKLIPAVVAGQDHTVDEIVAEGVTASVGNIVPGVSFDVWLSSPNGSSGKFLVNIAGF